MIRVIKKSGQRINAYEAMNGKGEIVCRGDNIKIDSGGFPYPNSCEFFLANHKPVGADQYEQFARKYFFST